MSTPQVPKEENIRIIMETLNLTDRIVSYKQLLQEQTQYFEIILPQEIGQLKKEVENFSIHGGTKKNAETEVTELTEALKLRGEIEKQVSQNTREQGTIDATIKKLKNAGLKTTDPQMKTAVATKAQLATMRGQLEEDLKVVTSKYNNLPSVKISAKLEKKKQELDQYNTYKTKVKNEAKALKPHIENVKNLISKERKELDKIVRTTKNSPEANALRKEHQDRLNEWIPYLETLNSPDYTLFLHLEKIPASLERQLDAHKDKTYKANKNEVLKQAKMAVESTRTGKAEFFLARVMSSLTDPNPPENTDTMLRSSANLSSQQGNNPNPAVYMAKMQKLQINITNRLHETIKTHVMENLITALPKTALEAAVKYCTGQLEQVSLATQKTLEANCYNMGWENELDTNNQKTGKLIYKMPGGDIVQMSDILESTYNAYVNEALKIDATKTLGKKLAAAEVKLAEGRQRETTAPAITEAQQPKKPVETTSAATSKIPPPSEPQAEPPIKPEPKTPIQAPTITTPKPVQLKPLPKEQPKTTSSPIIHEFQMQQKKILLKAREKEQAQSQKPSSNSPNHHTP